MGATLFAKNLIRLLKFDLKAHHKAIKKYADYEYMLDNLKYEICDEVKSLRLPKVLGQKESVAKIIRDKCSVVRYGDGEFNLMFGRAIGFQEYTPEIAARLTEVLQSDDPSILVGIPDRFGSLADVDAQSRAYWRTFMAKNRTQIYKYLNFEQTYADACFTAHAIEPDNENAPKDEAEIEAYYNEIRKIWDGRDITIIRGEGTEIFQHDIYDNAKSVNYIYGPKAHAFRDYDRLLAEAKAQPKDCLMIVVLGPTATVLAYDLAKAGYQALDIGHLGKAYDWLKRKETIVIGKFFAS